MVELNIITPVYKPANIPAIYHSIDGCAKGIRIVWWPIFDATCAKEGHEWRQRFSRSVNENLVIHCLVSEKADPTGLLHINYVLDQLEQDYKAFCDSLDYAEPSAGAEWVYFLFDDNVLHASLPAYLAKQDAMLPNGIYFAAVPASTQTPTDTLQCCIRIRGLQGQRIVNGASRFIGDWALANNFELSGEPLAWERYLS